MTSDGFRTNFSLHESLQNSNANIMSENSQTLFLEIQSLDLEDVDVEQELVEELLEPKTEQESQPKKKTLAGGQNNPRI